MTAFDRTVARVNEIADRDCPDREKVGDYLAAILDTQIAELIRSDSLRESGFTEIADLLDDMERRRVRAYRRLFDEADAATDEHDKALLQEAALIAEDPDAYCNAYPVGLARRPE